MTHLLSFLLGCTIVFVAMSVDGYRPQMDPVRCEHAIAAESRRDGWDLKSNPRPLIDFLDAVESGKRTTRW
jgi:hypothetical protein